jgi:hypothetical protein
VADSIKHVIHTLMMLWLLQHQLGGLRGHHISRSLIKAFAAALLTGLGAYGVFFGLAPLLPGTGFLVKLLHVALPGVAGVAVFIAAVFILDIREARNIWQIVAGKKS